MSSPTSNYVLRSTQYAVPWTKIDWLLLSLVTALGAALRFYQLGVVPPGFQFDEAFNAIDAAQVLHGNFPLFLPANAGREVLYTYFQAGLGALWGVNVFTLRLASALLGSAAVAATYLLLRRMLQYQSRPIAIFTSLTLAVSLWHIHFSHYGIRVITMPLLFCGLFGCYWLGVQGATRRTRLWGFCATGVLTGLGVWTNPTGRFVPFVLIVYTLWLLWREPQHRRLALDRPLGGLLLTGSVAFVIFLPLGFEFYRHPEWFTGHAAEVSVFAERVSGGNPWPLLLRNTLAVAGMFSVAGDREWAHGPAGRPVFDPLLSVPFVIGVGLWFARLWRRRKDDPDVDALALLALWVLVMLLPSVFSEAAPNYSRTLPSLPATFVATGLGLSWVAGGRWQVANGKWRMAVASLIVAASGVIAFYDYFIRFPRLPEVYYAYEANKLEALKYWEGLADDYEIYLHPLWADHPPVRALRSSKLIKALATDDTLVLPPLGKGAIYAYPPELIEQAEQVAALWPGLPVETPLDKFGNPLLAQVKVEATQLADWPLMHQPEAPLEARFEDAPTLLGMQAGHNGAEITLFWRGEERQTVRNLTAFVHLLDAEGQRVGQIDKLPGNGSYQTPAWSPGERVIEQYQPEISDPCAGGETVQVQVGWYELAAGGLRRPRLDAPGDMALAGELTLPLLARPLDQLALPNQVNLALGEEGTLLAYALRSTDLQAGAPLVVDLYLQGDARLAEQPVELRLEADQQVDVLWQGVIAPGVEWSNGEVICRRLRTRLPMNLAAGDAQLAFATAAATVPFHQVVIHPSTRRFDAPLTTPVDATLGNALKLLGYDLKQPTAVTSQLTITLIWQSLTAPAQSYTAFVHLLDETGAIITQSDAPPAGGYTTDRWIAGEVVSDTHRLTLPVTIPSGRYRLVAGLYDAVSGERLPVYDSGGQPLADSAVTLGEVRLP